MSEPLRITLIAQLYRVLDEASDEELVRVLQTFEDGRRWLVEMVVSAGQDRLPSFPAPEFRKLLFDARPQDLLAVWRGFGFLGQDDA